MNNEIKTYKDLIVWQKSMSLVEFIYKETQEFPKEEIFGITSQMRRCAVSIPSNIAEGRGRSTRKDYRQFLIISYGSASELETQLIIAHNLKYMTEGRFLEATALLEEIIKMLGTIIKRLKND
jgi:four helix bundle protein